MLRLCKFCTGSLAKEIEIEEAADDRVIRDEVEHFNNSADNRHPV